MSGLEPEPPSYSKGLTMQSRRQTPQRFKNARRDPFTPHKSILYNIRSFFSEAQTH